MRRTVRRLAIVAGTKGVVMLLALIFGCADSPTAPGASEDAAIEAAFFRALFAVESWPGAAAYCLSTGSWEARQDPVPDVLAALTDHQPPAVAGSRCTVELTRTVYDETGELAQSFHIERVERAGPVATVEGFVRRHALDATGGLRRPPWTQEEGRRT